MAEETMTTEQEQAARLHQERARVQVEKRMAHAEDEAKTAAAKQRQAKLSKRSKILVIEALILLVLVALADLSDPFLGAIIGALAAIPAIGWILAILGKFLGVALDFLMLVILVVWGLMRGFDMPWATLFIAFGAEIIPILGIVLPAWTAAGLMIIVYNRRESRAFKKITRAVRLKV